MLLQWNYTNHDYIEFAYTIYNNPAGSETLQPLVFVIVWGPGFSMLVSLVLVAVVYRLFHFNTANQQPRATHVYRTGLFKYHNILPAG